jgi:hypothetical protein
MTKRKITGQTIQWPKEKPQDRQYNGQKKNHRTDNTMAKRKITGQTIQWPKEKLKEQKNIQ